MRIGTFVICVFLISVGVSLGQLPDSTDSAGASEPTATELKAIIEYQRKQIAELTIEVDRLKRQLPTSTQPAATTQKDARNSIVANGDFEMPVVSGKDFEMLEGGRVFGNWTVGGHGIDWVGRANQAAHGVQCIDLSKGDAGEIYQDLRTAAGNTYELRFAMSGGVEAPTIKKLELWWGDKLVDTPTFDATGHTLKDMGWTYHSYPVKASGNITRLKFKSLVNSPYGPMIDDVSVVQVSASPPIKPPVK